MRAWWRSLAVDEKVAAIGWAVFVVFLIVGTWVGK